MPCYRVEEGSVVVTVRLTPKADRNRIDGVAVLGDGRMVAKIRVNALPADGAANTALIAFVAKSLRRPKTAIAIVSGATQRVKQLRILGDPAALALAVETWGAPQP